ncbi:MAG: TIGR01777 family oxidoreductase [Desulfobacterales bacterium]|nr:TIGR01777 family oxidoreductase [Desulfobacterales bacterium]
MRILMTGGTGFIGTHLTRALLRKGYEVVVTSRSGLSPFLGQDRYGILTCDTTKPGPWQEEVGRSDMVINLAGRSIFTRWNQAKKMEMEESRILTTEHLVDALPSKEGPLFLSASAVGFYGDRGDEFLGEDEVGGKGFLAELCQRWEAAATKAEKRGVRVVRMRFGAVLGRGGGALESMLIPYKMCLGGPLGSGSQWFSWVHIDDLVSAVMFLMENKKAEGPINFTAPYLARNEEFSRTLSRVVRRPAFFGMPSFMLKMVLGELGQEILFSQRVVPQKLSKLGFQFSYPSIEAALGHLVHKSAN